MTTLRSLLLLLVIAAFAACGGSGTGTPDGDGGIDDDASAPPDDPPETPKDPPEKCKPKTCEDLVKDGRQPCGTAAGIDGCGDVLDCSGGTGGDGCPGALFCKTDEDGVSRCHEPENACESLSVEEACAGLACGTASDGCDKQLQCPNTCATGDLCIQGECVTPTCHPKTCDNVGPGGTPVACGVYGSGCDGVELDCNRPAEDGGCGPNQVCNYATGQCDDPPCVKLTPAEACANETCGIVGDGCGGQINCETVEDGAFACPEGTTCGGGGVPGKCGAGQCDPIPVEVACAGKCGWGIDGCGGGYECSSENGGETCTGGEFCGGGGVPGECGKPPCESPAMEVLCAGLNCGTVSDQCGGTVSCGTCDTEAGEICGYETPNVCGVPQCQRIDEAVACAGKCGQVADGCGGFYTCDASNGGVSCSGGDWCGAEAPNECGGAPECTPLTRADCVANGYECGLMPSGCVGVDAVNCWPDTETDSCPPFHTCMGGVDGEPLTCKADEESGCTEGICTAIPDCRNEPQPTRVVGRVMAPDGEEFGVPNAIVYIPRDPGAPLPVIPEGPSCDRCKDEDLGPVLAAAVTDYAGRFSLEGNIPVGVPVSLVVKVGKWRRVITHTIDAAAACTTIDVPDGLIRLPRHKNDGEPGTHLPKIAIQTGQVDAMECVFLKMGVDASEFTVPGGDGRIHIYTSNGTRMGVPLGGACLLTSGSGSACDASSCQAGPQACSNCSQSGSYGSPGTTCTWFANVYDDVSVSATTLYDGDPQNGELDQYDMVVLNCQGGAWESLAPNSTQRDRMLAYANAGGRVFASHFSFSWLYQQDGFRESANWDGDNTNQSSSAAHISIGRERAHPHRIQTFARWMHHHGAATVTTSPTGEILSGSFTVQDPRDRVTSVNPGSEEWVYRTRSGSQSEAIQQFSFNTPFGEPAEDICGRVAFSAFHVTGSGNNTNNSYFPDVCGSSSTLTSEEKALAFMLFDLAACVSEGDPIEPPECTPRHEDDVCDGTVCGLRPDGCGALIDCGSSCPQGMYCGAGGECVPQTCTPATCASLGANCGVFVDGCGGTIECGECTDGQVCGLHQPGVCGTPSCTPMECTLGQCGWLGDGCGGALDCGDCPSGQACGAGGVPNQCGVGECTALTCEDLGFNCGFAGDGCGKQINCGSCTQPGETCGGGGQPNVCGQSPCEPLDCDDVGAECGWIGDGCGGAVDCGPCANGGVCGGAGPNLCGDPCEPQDCSDLNAECGAIADGCGQIIQCGSCPEGQVCGAQSPNQCGTGTCNPLTCEQQGANCGTIGDGCGGTIHCGPCTVPGETCGGGGQANVCGAGQGGCTPRTCQDAGAECGAVGDGCGGLLNCGSCGPGEVCGLFAPNQCGATG